LKSRLAVIAMKLMLHFKCLQNRLATKVTNISAVD